MNRYPMKKSTLFLAAMLVFCRLLSQVSLQTGSASFSLPVFSWSDSKSNLSSAISLEYSSGSGLKVDEIASNIGQGWHFKGSGVITRIQVGQPDDQQQYSPEGNDLFKRYPTGYLYNTADISQGCPEFLTRYPIYGHKNQLYAQHNKLAADKEMDYFTYEFQGNSGMFVIPRNNSQKVGVFLNDSKMKLWFDLNNNNPHLGIRTTITAFYIQDQNGIIYKFSEYETTKILSYGYVDIKSGRRYTQPKFKNGHVYHEKAFEDNSIHHPNI